ncbi:polysaccharide pyruvyl transferase family protein [Luteolibacter marinus]|uniref:polysaccharide pyruvyl transferase family protein n=1 Tax=Luteolibacter marinus TaxID=2776705 RepID=UPI001869160E|nr:polysaccharide pyruvyl transferase family protein [Luteolibacter marinus]
MEILSDALGDGVSARAGIMASPITVAEQEAGELDPRVTNFAVSHVGARLSRKWWLAQVNKRLGTRFQDHVRDLSGNYQGAGAALQLGGDNYSLDYGRPWGYMAIDRYLKKRGVPVFLWGASVGPFDSDPSFAPAIHAHLKTLDGIFVRETETQNYLERHGISENVHRVADPAFVMKPSPPNDPEVRALVTDEMIGINISPLVARFADSGEGGIDAWRGRAAEMVIAAGLKTGRPILLIPHVGAPKPDEDDFHFLESLRQTIGNRAGVPIGILPPLGAAALKWVIGRCAVFAGARTHSTIAALSSHVPTLSMSYSIKAVGINEDIFGHQEFCRSVKTLTKDEFADIIGRLIDEGPAIRADLERRIPEIQTLARSAGRILAETLAAH